ncbi:unnamed protein product [Camellia sinensis]
MEKNCKFSTMKLATLLMYLSNVEEGGETIFPVAKGNFSVVPWWNELSECGKKGLSVKPRMGDALLAKVLKNSTHLDRTLRGLCLSGRLKEAIGLLWRAGLQVSSGIIKKPLASRLGGVRRTIVMKLLYYDDVMPVDYEPPFFRSCSEQEAHNPWIKILWKWRRPECGRGGRQLGFWCRVIENSMKNLLKKLHIMSNQFKDSQGSTSSKGNKLNDGLKTPDPERFSQSLTNRNNPNPSPSTSPPSSSNAMRGERMETLDSVSSGGLDAVLEAAR